MFNPNEDFEVVQEDEFEEVSNILGGEDVLAEEEKFSVEPETPLISTPVATTVKSVPKVRDALIYDEFGGDEVLPKKDYATQQKKGIIGKREKELVETVKETGTSKVGPQRRIDAVRKAKKEVSNQIGDLFKNFNANNTDVNYNKNLGKKVSDAIYAFVDKNFTPPYIGTDKTTVAQLYKDAATYAKEGTTLKDLDTYSRKLDFSDNPNAKVNTQLRNSKKLALRSIVKDELINYATRNGQDVDKVNSLYRKWGDLNDLLDRAIEVASKGKGKVSGLLRSDNYLRNLLEAGKSTVNPAARTLSEGLGKVVEAPEKIGGKIAGKTGARIGKKAIPLAGAGFGTKETYDDLRERGYGGIESGVVSGVSGLGYLASDALNLGGVPGFAANIAIDEGIHQLATSGYDALRSWLFGKPEDAGTEDKLEAKNKEAKDKEKKAIIDYK